MPQPDCKPWPNCNSKVDKHVKRSIALWNRCAARRLPPSLEYSRPEQRKREKAYDEAVRAVERELKARADPGRPAMEDRLVAVFGRFATIALGLEDEAVRLITHDFLPVGTELARWARRFDPGLQKAEIVQACRNAWTACGLQPLLGRPTQLTPSILAYSLIYPYSDNYIDREDVTAEAKSRFSARFRGRLCGETPLPGDEYEAALWTLVGLIEEEYPRQLYPQVFESLLAIHSAQEQSIRQLNGNCCDADVLEISCAKGGTSVLADALLANAHLSEAESRFAFDWGVLLQLGDDLQDLRDDLRRGSSTLFTRAARRGEPLDALTTRLLVLSGEIAAGMDNLPHATPMLRTLMSTSWRSLIVGAVAGIEEFFSPRFLGELECRSPFRFGFLRNRQRKLTRRKGLYSSLFDALVEGRGGQDDRLPQPRARCAPLVVTSSTWTTAIPE